MQLQSLCSQTLDMATLPFPHLHYPSIPPLSSQIPSSPPSQEDLKRIAGHKAADLVESGMVLGLGTGSTAIHALRRISDLLSSGHLTDIVGIPTSKKTESQARSLNIPLSDLGSHPVIDLSIDGADEVDPHLNLVKGRGGSLLREKMIEGASRRFIVIVDETKMVKKIGGSGLAVPVEVIPFGWKYTMGKLMKLFEGELGFEAKLRMNGEEKDEIFVTDNGNFIVDLYFKNGGIEGDLEAISDEILRITGVVEHGMFLGMASEVIIAGMEGVKVVTKEEALGRRR